ncbi:MAG: cyclophilin family peptidyl-prolyl cis-trans isomerase [Sphingobacteriales bacterium]|jgi:cyclophilin family peptidyl-prolyl cis-trans isomerase
MKRIAIYLLFVSFAASACAGPAKKDTAKYVEVNTNFGTIVLMLSDSTPLHRDNFVKLVEDGIYDSLLFHRVINNFMIQGGDPNSKNAKAGIPLGSGSVGEKIPAEFNSNLIHKKGALAAARDNNPKKSSSSCQFYIVHGQPLSDDQINQIQTKNGIIYTVDQREIYKTIGGTAFLDQNYTVFGEVVHGMDVIDEIVKVKCDRRDRPIENVVMEMEMIKRYKAKKYE